MIDENIKLLKLLNPTSESLFETRKSINTRIDTSKDLNDFGRHYLEKNIINSLDTSIKSLNTQIYRLLNNIPIYIDYLKQIKVLNVYDSAVLLIQIKDINKFQKFQNLLSYSGFAPQKRGNQKLYKHLVKIGNKLKYDKTYSVYYHYILEEYQEKYPDWDQRDLENIASRKIVKTFLKNLYRIWKFQEQDK